MTPRTNNNLTVSYTDTVRGLCMFLAINGITTVTGSP